MQDAVILMLNRYFGGALILNRKVYQGREFFSGTLEHICLDPNGRRRSAQCGADGDGSVRMRIGFGYDSHRFEEGRRLVLGGVEFPGETGLKGHSDADVLVHAIIDALLGAAALGDIGSHFPDTDLRWKDADSTALLAAVVKEIRAAGYGVGNIDATVVCERPKLRPVIDLMRERLASVMNVGKGRISLKGKTNERMDAVGAGLGIVAHAVCLLEELGAKS